MLKNVLKIKLRLRNLVIVKNSKSFKCCIHTYNLCRFLHIEKKSTQLINIRIKKKFFDFCYGQ